MFRRTKRAVLVLFVAAQISMFAMPTVAAAGDNSKCLVWVWIDGWRCAVP